MVSDGDVTTLQKTCPLGMSPRVPHIVRAPPHTLQELRHIRRLRVTAGRDQWHIRGHSSCLLKDVRSSTFFSPPSQVKSKEHFHSRGRYYLTWPPCDLRFQSWLRQTILEWHPSSLVFHPLLPHYRCGGIYLWLSFFPTRKASCINSTRKLRGDGESWRDSLWPSVKDLPTHEAEKWS